MIKQSIRLSLASDSLIEREEQSADIADGLVESGVNGVIMARLLLIGVFAQGY